MIDVQGTADLSNITFNGQNQCVSWFEHHVLHHGG